MGLGAGPALRRASWSPNCGQSQLPLAWPVCEWLAAGTVRTVCLSSEVPKTEKSFEERLTFKAFLLKFVNSYTPIFYVAFFKGR